MSCESCGGPLSAPNGRELVYGAVTLKIVVRPAGNRA